jgi:hypothetical protein
MPVVGRRVGVILSGGNVDLKLLAQLGTTVRRRPANTSTKDEVRSV